MSSELIKLVQDDAAEKMGKAVEHARKEFSGVRTGRATPALVEKLPVDYYGDALAHVNDVPARNSLAVLRVVDTRANLLRASTLIQDAALDPYSFTRDAFLQKRRSDIRDGNDGNEPDESK